MRSLTAAADAAGFWRLVDVLDMRSCWAWRGPRQNEYGAYDQQAAHRYAWAFAYGPIPAGMHVLHSCDNSWCVNPRHLRVGTSEENGADRSVLSRVRAVLAEADVIYAPAVENVSGLPLHARIRELRKARGLTMRQLGDIIGAAQSCVCEWESGNNLPRGSKLGRLADALGVKVAALFAEAA